MDYIRAAIDHLNGKNFDIKHQVADIYDDVLLVGKVPDQIQVLVKEETVPKIYIASSVNSEDLDAVEMVVHPLNVVPKAYVSGVENLQVENV